MKLAGAIIALIAGVFGTIAAFVTLFVGGIGSAVGAEGGSTVVALGWGGVFFSFATLVIGAIAIGAKSKKPAVILIISSVMGMILGGTLVALFMVLAVAGGILNLVGVKKQLSGSA